jgi:hypothetical protein
MQLCQQRKTPDIWVETDRDRVKLDEVEDKTSREAYRSIERNIHSLLQRLRCPIHHDRLVDVVIIGGDSGVVDFNVYGCCQSFEASAKAQLLFQTRRQPRPTPNQLS